MTGADIPSEDHVLRYVRPSDILDLEIGLLNCTAFQLKPNELGLSVNWLEYSGVGDKQRQLDDVRSLIQLNMGRNGRLAELNVGFTLEYVGDSLPELRFVHSPSPAADGRPPDPSHSEIRSLPPIDSPESELIGDMIAQCVAELHPTTS